jgi:YHS domain-containing protein
MVMKNVFLFLFTVSFLIGFAQVDPVDNNGIAIGGYDVVAYFGEGKAKKGTEKYSVQSGSKIYLFSSSENQKLFEENPIKYQPQYDGYCALAVSYGKKISVDPQTFKISEGKLYLFYNGKSSNGKVNSLETWNKNEERLLKKANTNWPEVKKLKYKPEETF